MGSMADKYLLILKIKYMWIKLEVYNGRIFLGSIYTNSGNKQEIIQDIDKKFGEGKWTKYNIGN